MKTTLILSVALFLSWTNLGKAQVSTAEPFGHSTFVKKDPTFKNIRYEPLVMLRVNPLRAVADELRVELEWRSNQRWTRQAYLGWIHPNSWLAEGMMSVSGSPRFFHRGVVAGLGTRFHYNPEAGDFLEFKMLARHKRFDRERTHDEILTENPAESDGQTYYTLSQQVTSVNLQVLIGTTSVFDSPWVELYGGVGVMGGYGQNEVHSCIIQNWNCNPDNLDLRRFNEGFYLWPSLHMGFRVAIPLKREPILATDG